MSPEWVTGAFNECETGAERDVEDVLAEVFGNVPLPGGEPVCPAATPPPTPCSPSGSRAELDGCKGLLRLLEPATRTAE